MDDLICLEESDDCSGSVEWHTASDRPDGRAFPRCQHHIQTREESARRTLELTSPCPPAWFDPSYAGEHWDEDY